MSSSISDSDAAHAAWRRFLRALAVAGAIAAVAVSGVLIVIDPYDTGRIGGMGRPGLAAAGPRFANASRGRDPAFDSVVIGNSHLQLLAPRRLDVLLGGRFVSLTVPGTGAPEQMALLAWFRRHHSVAARTLVIGLDETWCGEWRPDRLANPFPFWLYAENPLSYLGGLASLESLEAAGRRLAYFAGRRRGIVADGFDDYEANRQYEPGPARERMIAARVPAEPAPPGVRNADGAKEFPALGRLAAEMDRFPAGTRKILVFPPRHSLALPPADSVAGARLAACKKAAADMVAERSGSWLMDFMLRGPVTEDFENFWDPGHYRGHIAISVEQTIAGALAGHAIDGTWVQVTRGR